MAANPPKTPPDGSAPEADSAVRRALSILGAFTYADPVLGVSELGRRLELPKTTVHRLLAILVNEGFVEKTPHGRYRLSLRLYEIGQEAVQSHGLRVVGHGPLETLRNETSETVHLAVLSGIDVVYVDRLESPQMMRMFTRIGRRRPAHATSSGKCLLAFGPQEDTERVLKAGLVRMAPRTITTRAAFLHSLTETRKNGFAVSTDESALGVVSVGAPIFDRTGTCVAAVSVVAPTMRLPDDALPRVTRQVLKAAADISKGLTREPTW